VNLGHLEFGTDMLYLIIASLIWAFSFGLIKTHLAGVVNPYLVACIRLSLSLVVFLPWLRVRRLDKKAIVSLLAIGAVQYGLMYITYIVSYEFLKSYQVALFTIFTPLYITLINDIQRKRIHKLFFVAALMAVLGTGVIRYTETALAGVLIGFALVQIANICFAMGQMSYRQVMKQLDGHSDRDVFGLLYIGAVLVSVLPACFTTDWANTGIGGKEILVLLYLGVLPAGVGFFLWNIGARKVNPGALAVMNNVKIPLAILCSLLVFNETADIPRLLIGGLVLIGAVFVSEWRRS
jgi:carboxylate/amino acid/amine transporter